MCLQTYSMEHSSQFGTCRGIHGEVSEGSPAGGCGGFIIDALMIKRSISIKLLVMSVQFTNRMESAAFTAWTGSLRNATWSALRITQLGDVSLTIA